MNQQFREFRAEPVLELSAYDPVPVVQEHELRCEQILLGMRCCAAVGVRGDSHPWYCERNRRVSDRNALFLLAAVTITIRGPIASDAQVTSVLLVLTHRCGSMPGTRCVSGPSHENLHVVQE